MASDKEVNVEQADGRRSRVDNFSYSENAYLIELVSTESLPTRATKLSLQIPKKLNPVTKFSLIFRPDSGRNIAWRRSKQHGRRCARSPRKSTVSYWIFFVKTGGGPAPNELSCLTRAIKEILPRDFMEIRNSYDDDSEITKTNNDAVTALQFMAGVRVSQPQPRAQE